MVDEMVDCEMIYLYFVFFTIFIISSLISFFISSIVPLILSDGYIICERLFWIVIFLSYLLIYPPYSTTTTSISSHNLPSSTLSSSSHNLPSHEKNLSHNLPSHDQNEKQEENDEEMISHNLPSSSHHLSHNLPSSTTNHHHKMIIEIDYQIKLYIRIKFLVCLGEMVDGR